MTLDVIATGSTGNAYLLTAEEGKLLLDCGIPFPALQKNVGFDWRNVHGCLVTHEHMDHIKAAQQLMRAGVDLYMSEGTAKAAGLAGHRLKIMERKRHEIGPFTVLPFDAKHDAAQPYGFLILYRPTGEKVLYLTDTAYSKFKFSDVHYFLVECNHYSEIVRDGVESGRINEELRIRLMQSHFSLERLIDFLKESVTPKTRKIALLHMSENNSDEVRMVETVRNETGVDTVAACAGLSIKLERYPF